MPKRSQREEVEGERPNKRLRSQSLDRFSVLSDELLLRILSFLYITDLVLCERLSHRLKSLAGDSQLWKGLFYDRFVRPRASRIPGIRDQGTTSARSLHYSSRISRWLQDDHLVKGGRSTNWKRQYKLRHNWSRGSACVTETDVADQPSIPPILVRLNNGIVVTADATLGLRALSLKGEGSPKDEGRLIASTALGGESSCNASPPTSLAINGAEPEPGQLDVSVGFVDGSFAIYTLMTKEGIFTERYIHAPSSNGTISAIAYASPYLLTMTPEPLLSLYRFEKVARDHHDTNWKLPSLLSSLKSYTAYPPLSLAIRTSITSITASIAYAMPTWISRWSVGLQELRLNLDGIILDSRMTSAANKAYIEAPKEGMPMPSSSTIPTPFHPTGVDLVPPPSIRPTSLSYNHPYLLTSHSDNTLTLYMVTSTTDELDIGFGNRLWGHTSSISGAHVGDRGKAVSVSTVGNELRVWELEGGIASHSSRKRIAAGETSVQVRPKIKIYGPSRNAQQLYPRGSEDMAVTKGWIAFDEEKIVLLKEKAQGAQALVMYDFT